MLNWKNESINLQSFTAIEIVKRKHMFTYKQTFDLKGKKKRGWRGCWMVNLTLNPNWCYKSYKSWLPTSLWSACTNTLLHKFLNRAEHMHKSTCRCRSNWLKHQVWLKSSFRLFCKGWPRVMKSPKAFSSSAAPLDGTLCPVYFQFSCVSNPNFFI